MHLEGKVNKKISCVQDVVSVNVRTLPLVDNHWVLY